MALFDELATRPVDPKLDWPFFAPHSEIDPADRATIRRLSEAAARAIWESYVSPIPEARHPMLLPSEHWLAAGPIRGPRWDIDWSKDASPEDQVVGFLRASIDWPDDTDCLFLWMRERAVVVPWRVFVRTWRAFLYDDEGPFLLTPADLRVVWFGPGGHMGVCLRPELPTDLDWAGS